MPNIKSKAKNTPPPTSGPGKVPAVAAYLAVSRSKVYCMMDSGDLEYVKLGKSRRIPWEAVEKLVTSNTVSR